MLPMYSFFSILAGYGLYKVKASKLKVWGITFDFSFAFILIAFFWTLSFLKIYHYPNTRIQATVWINQNVHANQTLAVEHWDDRIPVFYNKPYKFEELGWYNLPDGEEKWKMISKKIIASDYTIIASNRLYIPLQKLSDCTKYKICYPKTASYYQSLFHSGLIKTTYGPVYFKKVAEFTDYPALQFGKQRWVIKDDGADESFTVYDHPKIFIFEKENFKQK